MTPASNSSGTLNPRIFVPLAMGLWILWGFGYETIWQRLMLQIDGIVISSIYTPRLGASRYLTTYAIRGTDGRIASYIAGPTDASLGRSIPVGSRIRKEIWQLGYTINGRWIAFSVGFYILTLALAAGSVVWAAIVWLRPRRTLTRTDSS
jgi:hypothetical protein